MEQLLKFLGKRISTLRLKRGLTQEKLAELVHYSTNHISKLESARTKPSLELLFAVSCALQVELKELFNFDEYKNPDYIQKEIKELLKINDQNKIKLLYKIFKAFDV